MSNIAQADANHLATGDQGVREKSLEVVSVRLNISLKCSPVVKEMLKGMKVSY